MTRKINYRGISKEMENIVNPSKKGRSAISFDKNVGEFYYIPINDLIPFKNQARVNFNVQEIENLAESIKRQGVRQPLTVYRSKDQEGKYEVVSGERRLRAAKIANLNKVPCIILEDATHIDEIAFIENFHRMDLHPIELGSAFRNILKSGLFKSHAEMSEKLSIPKSSLSEHLSYCDLPKTIKQHLIKNDIKSRDILRKVIKYKDDQIALNRLLKLEKEKSIKNISILRFMYTEKGILVQKNGLKKLGSKEKKDLKKELIALVEEL